VATFYLRSICQELCGAGDCCLQPRGNNYCFVFRFAAVAAVAIRCRIRYSSPEMMIEACL